ncbi:hypothetical protein [Streptomyces heliomycini]|uniref:hypothetical protein n=1 Tax=Streptomyces heliomycini TaxID=284032 RepID=UPI00406BB0BF
MTVCAIEPAAGHEEGAGRAGCAITADGSYAARLALAGDSFFPERWTLDGPEPYAVPLPGNQPEEPGTEVQPLSDGRVLIHRPAGGRHAFSLLYPTGPGTGELPLGTVERPEEDARLRLLPPAPGGERAYALAVGRRSTVVWLVAGGAFGPEQLAEVPGRCSGGVWLDREGRMLALDRESGGCTKAVVVDLERGGETSPLLQIADGSDDRVLLADPDSGLLLIRSDAPSPGQGRLGWGVLGSTLPVRFPECLRPADCAVTPFAIQPGQMLTPEGCAVALRIDGAFGSWVGVWRPAERRVHHFPAPAGWLAGAGLWTADGVLRLPYATGAVPCGVAGLRAPWQERRREGLDVRPATDLRQAPGRPAPAEPVPVPASMPDGGLPTAVGPVAGGRMPSAAALMPVGRLVLPAAPAAEGRNRSATAPTAEGGAPPNAALMAMGRLTTRPATEDHTPPTAAPMAEGGLAAADGPLAGELLPPYALRGGDRSPSYAVRIADDPLPLCATHVVDGQLPPHTEYMADDRNAFLTELPAHDAPGAPAAPRPVPLQQAPLGRLVTK